MASVQVLDHASELAKLLLVDCRPEQSTPGKFFHNMALNQSERETRLANVGSKVADSL